jgi:hypothetical protein
MSVVNWLFRKRLPKPARSRQTCDYCNQPQRAMQMRCNWDLGLTTCNWKCEDAYLEAVYRKPTERFDVC